MSEHFFDDHHWSVEHPTELGADHDQLASDHVVAEHEPLDHDGLHHDFLEHLEHDHSVEPLDRPEHPAEIDDAYASYPPHLPVAVEPTDGRDWVDPGLLGADLDLEAPSGSGYASPAELLDSLHASAGPDQADGPASWEALSHSDDPAIRALAHLWAPDPLAEWSL